LKRSGRKILDLLFEINKNVQRNQEIGRQTQEIGLQNQKILGDVASTTRASQAILEQSLDFLSALIKGETVPCPRLIWMVPTKMEYDNRQSLRSRLDTIFQHPWHIYFICEKEFRIANPDTPMVMHLDRQWLRYLAPLWKASLVIISLASISVGVLPLPPIFASSQEAAMLAYDEMMRNVIADEDLNAISDENDELGIYEEMENVLTREGMEEPSQGRRCLMCLTGASYDFFMKEALKEENRKTWESCMHVGSVQGRPAWIANDTTTSSAHAGYSPAGSGPSGDTPEEGQPTNATEYTQDGPQNRNRRFQVYNLPLLVCRLARLVVVVVVLKKTFMDRHLEPISESYLEDLILSASPNTKFHGAPGYALDLMLDVAEEILSDDRLIQRFALITLYYAIYPKNGEIGWFGFDQNECKWDLRSSGTSIVERVILSGQGSTGQIPIEIGLLTRLSVLWLDHNPIVGTLPSEFGLLTDLIELDISSTMAVGTIPTEWGSMRSLIDLRLEGNVGLTGTVPSEFGHLTNLKRLWLDGTSITGMIPESLCSHANPILVIDCDKIECSGNCCYNAQGTACHEWIPTLHPTHQPILPTPQPPSELSSMPTIRSLYQDDRCPTPHPKPRPSQLSLFVWSIVWSIILNSIKGSDWYSDLSANWSIDYDIGLCIGFGIGYCFLLRFLDIDLEMNSYFDFIFCYISVYSIVLIIVWNKGIRFIKGDVRSNIFIFAFGFFALVFAIGWLCVWTIVWFYAYHYGWDFVWSNV